MSLFLVSCLATVQPLGYKPVWMQTASLLSMLLPGEEGTYQSNVFNIIKKNWLQMLLRCLSEHLCLGDQYCNK